MSNKLTTYVKKKKKKKEEERDKIKFKIYFN